jgi:hypothetical protein
MCGFRYCFTPLTGVLFTFRSRYWFAIGRRVVFSLGGWSLRIQAGFHVSDRTRVSCTEESSPFAYGAVTRCGAAFQKLRLDATFVTSAGDPGRQGRIPRHRVRNGLGLGTHTV